MSDCPCHDPAVYGHTTYPLQPPVPSRVAGCDGPGPLESAREIAYTCDTCQSAHWLTLYPAGGAA